VGFLLAKFARHARYLGAVLALQNVESVLEFRLVIFCARSFFRFAFNRRDDGSRLGGIPFICGGLFGSGWFLCFVVGGGCGLGGFHRFGLGFCVVELLLHVGRDWILCWHLLPTFLVCEPLRVFAVSY
jgi:hypothetical protein